MKHGYIVFRKQWDDEEIAYGLELGVVRAGLDMYASYSCVSKRNLYNFMAKCFPEIMCDSEWELVRKMFFEELKEWYKDIKQ